MFHHVLFNYSTAAGWTPIEGGALGWWDATDSASVTEAGGAVSQWDDQTANGYNWTQGTAARQPTYTDGQYITFDGTTDHMTQASRFGLGANPDLLVIGVFYQISASGDDIIFAIGNDVRNLMVGAGANYQWQFFTGDYEKYNAPTNSVNFIAAFTHPSAGNYGSSAFFENGTEQAYTSQNNPTQTPSDTSVTASIGGDSGYAQWINARFIEFMIFEDVTTDTRQKAEGFLAWKHGGAL